MAVWEQLRQVSGWRRRLDPCERMLIRVSQFTDPGIVHGGMRLSDSEMNGSASFVLCGNPRVEVLAARGCPTSYKMAFVGSFLTLAPLMSKLIGYRYSLSFLSFSPPGGALTRGFYTCV